MPKYEVRLTDNDDVHRAEILYLSEHGTIRLRVWHVNFPSKEKAMTYGMGLVDGIRAACTDNVQLVISPKGKDAVVMG